MEVQKEPYQHWIAYISAILSKVKLKFAKSSYFKALFQNLKPKSQ